MEAKEKSLLRKIAKGIVKDGQTTFEDRELENILEKIVESSPSLTWRNRHMCLQFFTRYVKRAVQKHGRKAQPVSGPLGADEEETAGDDGDQRAAVSLHTLSPTAHAQFIVQQLHRETDIKQLAAHVDESEESLRDLCPGLDNFSKLLAQTAGSTDITVLEKVMQLRFVALQEEAEQIVTRKDQEHAREYAQALCSFLQMCHLRRSVCIQQESKVLLYSDLLASLLSVYLDLFLVSQGNDAVEKKQQKRLCSLVHHLMVGCGMRIFDVILQVTAANQENASCLLLLVRKILSQKPDRKSHEDYLRHIMAVRMWSRFLDLQDLVMEARLVKAPKGFLTWLLERNPALSEELPTDRKFKGRVVTSFLLDDADDNVCDMLLDALVETEKGQGTREEEKADGRQAAERQSKIKSSSEVTTQIGLEKSAEKGEVSRKKRKASEESKPMENGTKMQGDSLFVVDRAGDSSGDVARKLKKRKKLKELEEVSEQSAGEETRRVSFSENTEVFDLSGSLPVPGVNDIFTIDRNRQNVDDVDGEGLTDSPVVKKKRRKMDDVKGNSSSQSVHKREEVQVPSKEMPELTAESPGLFFMDRGAEKRGDDHSNAEAKTRKVKLKGKKGRVARSNIEEGSSAATGENEVGVEEKENSFDGGGTCDARGETAAGTEPDLFMIDRGIKRNSDRAKTANLAVAGVETAQQLKSPGVQQASMTTRRRTASERSVEMTDASERSEKGTGIASETESLADDVHITTESSTDISSPLPGKGTAGSNKKSLAKQLFKRKPSSVDASDAALFSEPASETDSVFSKVNKAVSNLHASESPLSSVVDNSASDDSDNVRAIPDLLVHLKTSIKAQTKQSPSVKQRGTESPGVTEDGEMKRGKRRLASQSSQEGSSKSTSPQKTGVSRSPRSPEFKKTIHKGTADNGSSYKVNSPAKSTAENQTPSSTQFTEVKQRKGKSITPVARRTRSHREEDGKLDTPKRTSVTTQDADKRTKTPDAELSSIGDTESSGKERDGAESQVCSEASTEKGESKSPAGRLSLSSKETSGNSDSFVSKKADRRQSAVLTRAGLGSKIKKEAARRKSAGVVHEKTPSTRLRRPSKEESPKGKASPKMSLKASAIRDDDNSDSDERGAHEIETRSKSLKKGYNLRRSGK